jgi:dienelactone hydrolase
MRRMLPLLGVAAILASCSGGGAATPATPSTSTPAMTGVPDAGMSNGGGDSSVEVVRDLVYISDDERFRGSQEAMNVVAPGSGDGPWPIVVVFHPLGKGSVERMATAIASEGRVVFAPDWGRLSAAWEAEGTLREQWGSTSAEVRCAVAFATERATQYGGDPANVTLMGYSGGGNAALMAAFSDLEPPAGCAANGPAAEPRAVVSVDGDVLLGAPLWDDGFAADPEAFYALTPWRDLDPDDRFSVVLMHTDTIVPFLQRTVGSDPTDIDLDVRHVDIDLRAGLEAMGILEDGVITNLEANEWATQALLDAGYDARFVLLPDSSHASSADWGLSDEAWRLAIDTVVDGARHGG